MDVLKRTIHVPVWYDEKRIYVPTADIPFGRWTVLLSLVPIRDAWTEIEPLRAEPSFVEADFPAPVHVMDESGEAILGGLSLFSSKVEKSGRQLTLKFENRLHPTGSPVAAQYSLVVDGLKDGKTSFDPVMIAQPDPIYP